MSEKPRRNIALLVPSGITILAIGALLLVARFYEFLPVKPPGCGFRRITGIPCLGCGGTRCMMALSRGELVKSFLFNPAVFVAVVIIAVWFIRSVIRYLKHDGSPLWPVERTHAKRLFLRWFLTVGIPLLLLLNWIYLAIYLPE